jgi:hypothetical protein
MMSPGQILILASLAANAVLGWAYLDQRDETATARADLRGMEGQRDGARQAASACSVATEALRELADRRAAAAAPAREAAANTARNLAQRADHFLGLKPRDPADQCASMQALGDEWLQGRAKP